MHSRIRAVIAGSCVMLIQAKSAAVTAVLSFVAGSIIGILFAPASGTRTRRRVIRNGEDLAEKAAGVKESAQGLFECARRRIA